LKGLLGVLGVIASLVYLATQIRPSREQMRQNTRALRSESFQQIDGSLYQVVNGRLVSPATEVDDRLPG